MARHFILDEKDERMIKKMTKEEFESFKEIINSLLKDSSPLPWASYSEKFPSVKELSKAVAKSVNLNDSAEIHWIEPSPGNGTWPAVTGNGTLSKTHAKLIVTVMNNLPDLFDYVQSLQDRLEYEIYQSCYPDG